VNILAIETSCDETSIALVKARGGLRHPRFLVLKNLISSQIKIHRPFGGVVPNLAKREHLKNLPILCQRLINQKSRARNKKQGTIIQNSQFIIPDVIAVTVGPGLEPALWTGIEFAKNLSQKLRKPLVGVNHLEGHIYSNVLKDIKIKFPAVTLLVSGGHTILLLMQSLTQWKKLGETRDDAAGEAFDKVARLLNLPYPGGPELEKLAKHGNPYAITFPRPMLRHKNYDFSFSGLKTAVLYFLRDHKDINKEDVAASFQQAVIDVLVEKTMRAAVEFKAKSVMLCGGVAANKLLRKTLTLNTKQLAIDFYVPNFKYNTDNAAMIAAAAYIRHIAQKRNYRIAAQPNLNL